MIKWMCICFVYDSSMWFSGSRFYTIWNFKTFVEVAYCINAWIMHKWKNCSHTYIHNEVLASTWKGVNYWHWRQVTVWCLSNNSWPWSQLTSFGKVSLKRWGHVYLKVSYRMYVTHRTHQKNGSIITRINAPRFTHMHSKLFL